MNIKSVAGFLITMVFIYNINAQDDTTYTFGEDQGEIEYFFGFNLVEGMGTMVNLALVKPGTDGKNIIKHVNRDDFIAQAKGKQESLANPKAVDFFKKYEIDDPNVIDNLWRLRYKEYPYYTGSKPDPGWSANDSIPFLPTEAQMQILQKFGINRMSDYVYGENAFRLLRLISLPEWINSYKGNF